MLFLCLVACDGGAAATDTAEDPVVTEAVDGALSNPEVAADSSADSPAEDVLTAAVESGSGDQPPMPYSFIWQPWHGDFDGMVERRIIRALVPFGGYQFYYEDGRPRGASYDLLQRLEEYVNKEAGRKNIKVYVVAIP